jgi:hypothetical protein
MSGPASRCQRLTADRCAPAPGDVMFSQTLQFNFSASSDGFSPVAWVAGSTQRDKTDRAQCGRRSGLRSVTGRAPRWLSLLRA